MATAERNMHYTSKLLLFGEHTINRGSNALAMPYAAFGGTWAFSDDLSRQQGLPALAAYLENLQQEQKPLVDLDLLTFRNELAQGLFFDSNIPVGYGLGSSGALCAAVYDRFGTHKIERTESARFQELRQTLAQIECFFHGSSSGTDPLICYLNQPILIKTTGAIEMVTLPLHSELTFFLIDTEMPRSTGPLVSYFLKRCEEPDFTKNTLAALIHHNNRAIEVFLQANWKQLYEELTTISVIQMKELPEMIPPRFQPIWQEGWKDDLYRLKLCGAGGGGFILGVTLDWNHTRKRLADYKLLKINGNVPIP